MGFEGLSTPDVAGKESSSHLWLLQLMPILGLLSLMSVARMPAIYLTGTPWSRNSTWKMVMTRKAPNLLADPSPLLLPQASLMEVTRGRMRPPDRAATLGIAGARKASLQ